MVSTTPRTRRQRDQDDGPKAVPEARVQALAPGEALGVVRGLYARLDRVQGVHERVDGEGRKRAGLERRDQLFRTPRHRSGQLTTIVSMLRVERRLWWWCGRKLRRQLRLGQRPCGGVGGRVTVRRVASGWHLHLLPQPSVCGLSQSSRPTSTATHHSRPAPQRAAKERHPSKTAASKRGSC